MSAFYAWIGGLAQRGLLPADFQYPFLIRGFFGVLLLTPILGGLSHLVVSRRMAFFSATLGWLGVFLTGSDTSANALFGPLQTVTATKLGMSPILMASSNSAAGVMGKMISLTSIAVAAAATSMKREDEALLFRFTLKHSIFLASMIGLIVMFYAYVMPAWAP